MLRMRILDVASAKATILNRQPSAKEDFEKNVQQILDDVRREGDAALMRYIVEYDKIMPASLIVQVEHIAAAYEQLDSEIIEALRMAASRIEAFHRRQPVNGWIQADIDGVLGQLIRPIERVGIYVPAGNAPLPSTVLMSVIPAKVAGVRHVAIMSKPQADSGLPHPAILVAADIAGADAIYVGSGAQGIAAFAYGTESIKRVDKIFGPGSNRVQTAKRKVFGLVGIDGFAGATETVVVADEHANPQLVAADLLAQAEHDKDACAILLTDSKTLAEQVQTAVMAQLEELDHQEELLGSLSGGSGIVVTESLLQSIELANEYAPEHLCLCVQDPWNYVGRIHNAGGIFIGENSFEVLGDYVAGPSHVMPTGGTARFAGSLSVVDFVKVVSIIGLNEDALHSIGPVAEILAQLETLTAHAAAVRRRREVTGKTLL